MGVSWCDEAAAYLAGLLEECCCVIRERTALIPVAILPIFRFVGSEIQKFFFLNQKLRGKLRLVNKVVKLIGAVHLSRTRLAFASF